MNDMFEEGYDCGYNEARKELLPLVEAITDAITMFEDIERNRKLPDFQATLGQYVSMGNQLRRLLDLSNLRYVQ